MSKQDWRTFEASKKDKILRDIEGPFYIVNQDGLIVAQRIPTRALAEEIVLAVMGRGRDENPL